MNKGERKHFYWLDWVRFLAAFSVLIFHTRWRHWGAWGELNGGYKNWITLIFFGATRLRYEPVVVFFVLSGFLVGGRVGNHLIKGTFDVGAYVIDRVSRIYVPLIPALAFTAVIGLTLGNKISFLELIGNLVGLQGAFCSTFCGNQPLWSLAYENWFYILAGVLAVAIGARNRGKRVAFIGIVLVFIVFTRLDYLPLFCWLLGAISYGLLTVKPHRIWFLVGAVLIFGASGCYELSTATISTDTRAITPFVPPPGVSVLILSLGLAFVLPYLAQQRPNSRRLESFERMGTRLGAFSYTLYLTHLPILNFWHLLLPQKFFQVNVESLLWFAAKLASCLGSAWLIYLLFEARTWQVRILMRRWFGMDPAGTNHS